MDNSTVLDRDALRAALIERLPAFVRAHVESDTLVREHGTEIRVGRRGSLSVRLDSGAWFDHEAGRGGDVLDLARALTNARDFHGKFVLIVGVESCASSTRRRAFIAALSHVRRRISP